MSLPPLILPNISAPLGGASGPSATAVSIDATNLQAVYSVVRVNSWSGNCLQVRRSSDNTTLDIGFKRNVVDWATADAFAAGSSLFVSKWYDQSGNGNDRAQATAANQPNFTILNNWFGIRPITFGQDGTGSSQWLDDAGVLTLNRNGLTVYMAVAPRLTWAGPNAQQFSYIDLGDAALATTYWRIDNTQTSGVGPPTCRASSNISMARNPRAQLQTVSWSSGTTQISRTAGTQISGGGQFTSQAIAAARIGTGIAPNTTALFNGDYFFLALYGVAHNSAAMQAVEASLNTSFTILTSFTNRLAYGGNSLTAGTRVSLCQQPYWQAGFGKPTQSGWENQVYAIPGVTLANQYTNRVAIYGNSYDATKSKNVAVVCDPSNDIATTAYTSPSDAVTKADTLFTGTTLAYVTYLLGLGYRVVVPTCIVRGGIPVAWDTTTNWKENARVEYNAQVLANAVANGYTVSDRAAQPALQNYNDTTYFYTDKVHLIVAGAAVQGACDAAAILAA